MTESDTGVTPRLAATLDHWKRSLLDLTKRNRAIHFRATPVSTLILKDEQPADLYRRLVIKRAKMRFKADETKDKIAAQQETTEAEAAGGFVELPETPEQPLTTDDPAGRGASSGRPTTATNPQAPSLPEPISPSSPASPVSLQESPRETSPAVISPSSPASPISRSESDAFLQTTSSSEQLDKSLLRLDEQAQLSIEEQGVNTLFLALGMLHYTDETGPLRAPLLLVPVGLTRKSARTGYILAATEDEPLLNPALVEYLRRAHTLDLPDLPDHDDDEAYDLGTWLAAVRAAISEQRGWSVQDDCVLALFSFQKFVMYKDLEAHGDAMQKHELVRRLVSRNEAALPGLPPDVLALDLDRDFPPETTFQVVDADASQLRAIAAASLGYNLVVEGPPGTGKSQTITNLIARALADGKTVLFVAEKMAALEVVYRRLVVAGLGEFCLELHSTKANKRAVLASLRAALDASLQHPPEPAGPDAAAPRLPAARQALSDYAAAVHTPHGGLAVAPYYAYGELETVLDAPRLRFTGAAEQATPDALDRAIRALDDLSAAARRVGGAEYSAVSQHPWRDTTRTYYTEANLDDVRALAGDVTARLAALTQRAAELQAALDLQLLAALPDMDAALHISEVISRSPGAPMAALRSPAWDSAPASALAIIARGRRIGELWGRVRQRFQLAVLEYDHSGDISFVEQKAQGALSFLSILDARWRDIRRRWLGYRAPGYAPTLLEQAQEMRVVGELQQERLALSAAEAEARHHFGGLWKGEGSNWDALDAYVRWVVEFRALVNRHALTGRALDLATRPAPPIPAADALRPALATARQALTALRAAVGWPADYLAAAPVTEIESRARGLAENLPLAPRWAAFESARAAAATTLAAEVLAPAMAGEVPFDSLSAAFRRAFWQRWLAGVVPARDPLRNFHTPAHEQRVTEFRALDEQVLRENRAALVAKLRVAVQERLRAPEAAAGLPFLRREMARQRGLSPLRRTFQQAGAAVRAIKPCFMMSPLSVAQLLEVGDRALPFDLVIFDEASQLPAEDAVGAIARGQQLVVVGDPKQLPPTNFFAVMNGQANAPLGDDGLPLYEDSESVLEEYLAAGVPASRLTWHYRSRHESLIAFSNLSFYDAGLNTFPSVEFRQPNPPVSPSLKGKGGVSDIAHESWQEGARDIKVSVGTAERTAATVPPSPSGRGDGGEGELAAHLPTQPKPTISPSSSGSPISLSESPESPGSPEPSGLAFTFVPDGVYTGAGLNPAEARAVADAVVAHARAYPTLTLGVGTFNLRQQQAIQDELEQRRRADPSLDSFFAAREEGAFFVKNLENIQGDERDVIFISVTYARDPAGKLRYNFGPLNLQNGWRRLNVLVTRSRLHMRVFASIHGDDLDAATPSAGAQLLRRFLLFAERGTLDDARLAEAAAARQTAFERQVFNALTARGYQLDRQVGVSGYRIDFAVRDPAVPGRYLCGLECDGLAYRAAPTARDRDRLRQQVLEARGWTLHRIWSTDWFKDRAGQLERLVALIEADKASALADERGTQEMLGTRGTEESEGLGTQGTRGTQESGAARASTQVLVASSSFAAAPSAQSVAATPADPNTISPSSRSSLISHSDSPESPPSPDDYLRPEVPAYRFAPGEGRNAGKDLLQAQAAQLRGAILRIAEIEAPLHLDDLVARVAGMWDTRLGSRIRARIDEAIHAAAAEGGLALRGEFVWLPAGEARVRSRAGTKIPPERLAPEEVRAALLLVLGTGFGFPLPALANEVRALFGYGRGTDELSEAVEAQVKALIAEGVVGEGSMGLMLRS